MNKFYKKEFIGINSGIEEELFYRQVNCYLTEILYLKIIKVANDFTFATIFLESPFRFPDIVLFKESINRDSSK